MSNNSLMPINENIFSKIKNFFKNLFFGQTIESYELNTSEDIIENKQEIRNSIFAENIKVEETEEQKLLKLQRLIRENRILESDLSKEEKNKLRELYNSQIEDIRNSILQKRNKIMRIKYEQKRKAHSNTEIKKKYLFVLDTSFL